MSVPYCGTIKRKPPPVFLFLFPPLMEERSLSESVKGFLFNPFRDDALGAFEAVFFFVFFAIIFGTFRVEKLQ